jgi:hypothetical protein
MKEFEGVAENYLNGIYDIIVQETHNLSMSTEPSIIDPTTHLLETLPFNFIEKDWISLFNLDFAQAFGFINQLSVGLSSTWPYIPPSLRTMTSSIDWEQVRAEAEHEHHMRRMRLREENNVASRPVPQCEERKTRHLEEVVKEHVADDDGAREVVTGDGNTKATDEMGAGDDGTTEKPSPVPMGLGHPPSFTLTKDQVKDHPFR